MTEDLLLSLFFVFSAFVPFSVILRVDAHSAMAQGKESSVICMSARSIVTSVLLFCFGHDLQLLVQVYLVVDLLLCRSTLVTLDTVVWLSG